MDLFKQAFNHEFEPHLDKDASIKFILNTLMKDKSMDRLVELLDLAQQVGCIEGEPGWELERIEGKDRELAGYAEWPNWAFFRVYVDPDFFELVEPEAYYSIEDFKSFLNQAINACVIENIEVGNLVELIDCL